MEEQLWLEETFPQFVNIDSSLRAEIPCFSTDQCTVSALSWDIDGEMADLTVEQRKAVSILYNLARKTVHLESHINFLQKSLECDFVPKNFRINQNRCYD